jgi:hypothetical protein
MLVAADMARNLDCASSARVRVQTVSSSDWDAGAGWGWGPVKTSDRHPCPRWCANLERHNDAAVVAGGVVHWLIHCGISSSSSLQEAAGEYILTYDVNAAAVGSVDVPKDRRRPDLQRERACDAVPAGVVTGREAELRRRGPLRGVRVGSIRTRLLGAARADRHEGGGARGTDVAAMDMDGS